MWGPARGITARGRRGHSTYVRCMCTVHGICIYAWCVHGVCMVYARYMHVVYMHQACISVSAALACSLSLSTSASA